MRYLLPFLIAGRLLCQVPVPPEAGDAFMLRGATIHTISGPVIENGSILVRDGKIVGVGKNLTAPEGVRVIDVTGQQVYPGMIDSGSTLGMGEPGSTAQVTEPGSFHPQLRSGTEVNPASELFPLTRNNGVTSVVTVPDGELIPGQLSLIHLDGSPDDTVAMHLRFPAIIKRPIPPHESEDDDEEPTTAVETEPIPYSEAKKTYDGQMKKLNAFFDDARRYQHAKLSKKQPAADLRLEAMIPVLDSTRPMFVTAVREREIRAAIAFANKQKIRIILADAYESYKAIDLIKRNKIPVVLGPTLSLPLDRDDDYDRSFTTPAELYKAGIKFSIATFGARSSRNLPYQAAAAVAYGLPEDEAYKAVSMNAAEIFGLSRRLGSIDEGKIADLIVTDGNPLEARTHVTQVFIDGKPVDMRTRQQQLFEKYGKRP
jgi:imidazolonepropionase-like amidohydrolase